MYGRNGRVVFAFCLTLLVPNQLFARDDGRFEPPARASSSANNANDGSTHLLKVSNLIQAHRCDCAQNWVSMKPPRTEYLA